MGVSTVWLMPWGVLYEKRAGEMDKPWTIAHAMLRCLGFISLPSQSGGRLGT